jgi:hypothetical protein
MKTYIIQLQGHDDIVSARDKMGWAKGGRILLVWPERGDALNRRLDLTLLKRRSVELGAQLAIVSQDAEVRYHAPRLGIPVYKSLRKAQNEHWRVPRRFRTAANREAEMRKTILDAPRSIPAKPQIAPKPMGAAARLGFFSLGVLALLAIAAALSPSAVVAITPQTKIQDVTLEVWTGADATSLNLRGEIPSQWHRVIVEGRDTLPASGAMRLPDQAAEGTVQFTNLTDQEIKIPVGTVILNIDEHPIRFAVQKAGVLPAGSGNTINLPVRALTPGSQGNLPANSLVAVEGALGAQISATNPEPTHSGSDRQTPAPTAEDRRTLQEHLHNALQETALQEMREDLAEGDLLITESLNLLKVIEESFQPAENQPADQLVLNLRLEYQARVVSAQDLFDLAQAIFDANLEPGFAPIEGSLQIEPITAPRSSGADAYTWQMHAYRRVRAQYPSSRVIQLVLGLPPQIAKERLQTALALEEPVRIRLNPAWWPRLPLLPFRVSVIFDDGTSIAEVEQQP